MSAMGGSGGDDDENPFLFKKFIAKKNNSGDQSDENDETTTHSSSTGSVKDSKPMEEKEENPFSFKRFLHTGHKKAPQPGPSLPVYLPEPNIPDDNAVPVAEPVLLPSPPVMGPPPDVMMGGGRLPDFVQDQLLGEVNENGPGFFDPDFALLQQPPDVSLSAVAPPDVSMVERGARARHDSGDPLPDFLSDGAINGHVDDTSPANGLPLSNLSREQLINDILMLRGRLAEAESRHTSLQREHEHRQRQEARETRALEEAVQQVERNLSISQERAARAERQITTLRQENTHLQETIQALRAGSGAESVDTQTQQMGDQARDVANRIQVAAVGAEDLLKQLLSGVDNLKLLSSALKNLDKVHEPSPDQT